MRKRSSRRTPRLGQHFLTGIWAARSLARAAGISKSDTVVEVGPGTGALTKELLAEGVHVIAIEKDERLVAKMKETFRDDIASGNLRIVAGDIRDTETDSLGLENNAYTVAANIPYYITGEILRMFLSAEVQPSTMALLVQKEVAQRVVAKKESILSLSVKVYGTPKVIAKVSRGNFSPPPRVHSAILAITNISRMFFKDIDEELFFKLVRAGFSSKRKQLAGNLARFVSKPSVLEAFVHCDIPAEARAEDVPLEKWGRLVKALAKQKRLFSR